MADSTDPKPGTPLMGFCRASQGINSLSQRVLSEVRTRGTNPLRLEHAITAPHACLEAPKAEVDSSEYAHVAPYNTPVIKLPRKMLDETGFKAHAGGTRRKRCPRNGLITSEVKGWCPMTTIHSGYDASKRVEQSEHVDPQASEPLRRIKWIDDVTGAKGYLVIHTLVAGLATGGTRMRVGCTLQEVEDLARTMALKTAAFDLPVGGAKAGIDFDPKDPQSDEVLERFYTAMRPWLDEHWITAEDMGVSQQALDKVFATLGLGQSFHAAIERSDNPARTQERIRTGLKAETDDGFVLGDIIGGYGVAQACLGAVSAWNWAPQATSAAIQGIGTMGGGAAFYLHEAGVRVIAIADAAGTLYDYNGLDIPYLLSLRNEYGEIDRSQVDEDIIRMPREAIIETEANIFVPAAMSYAIAPDDVESVAAMVIVEAANSGVIPEAEAMLAARGVPVIPDFVANTGSAAWAWWLILGDVGTNPDDSFNRLRKEMVTKVLTMLKAWDQDGTLPRQSAWEFAQVNASAEKTLVIP